MQRRKLLKALAAGGAVGLGMSTTGGATQLDVEELEEAEVVRDGEVVEHVTNPTSQDLDRLETVAGSDGRVRYVDDCSTYCERDCEGLCSGMCHYTHTCSDTKWCC